MKVFCAGNLMLSVVMLTGRTPVLKVLRAGSLLQ